MDKKKIIVITVLTIIAFFIFLAIFSIIMQSSDMISFAKDKDFKEPLIGTKIAEPDRMVYKDKEGNYYQFQKGSEKYNILKNLLDNCIEEYNSNGEVLNQEKIDEIHNKSFIEFDYKTISKNYIIMLEKNDNEAVIRLQDTGGKVISKKIRNLNKIEKSLKKLIKNEVIYKLEYKEMFSKNTMDMLEYKYTSLFKQVDGAWQVKITNIEDFEKFNSICNFAIEEKITEETFFNNDIILTVTTLPNIDIKVSLGNIRYIYSRMENAFSLQYYAHLLIVNKIVNTDCIYNTDMSEIENRVEYDNMKVEYNKNVDKLDPNTFVVDFEKFINSYNTNNKNIKQEEAKNIAEKGFKEAEKICGVFDPNSEEITEEIVFMNNFFTRKMADYGTTIQTATSEEMDKTYTKVNAYVFTRYDDMKMNGVKVFVDKKSGKIVGGKAFGN